MKKIAFVSIAVGLLVITGLRGQGVAVAAEEESLRQRMDPLVKPYVDNNIVVGMTIGVLRNGKREVFGYGRISRDDRQVPDGDVVYELGSVTKVLTGILLADAVVEGQVSLDQAAGELLPAGVKMPASGDRFITLKDLATHVSGLPKIPDNMKLSNPNDPYADYTEEDLYDFLKNYELDEVPGKQIEYSNLGYGLLGHLLSLRAKSTYEDLIRNRIAEPLKMTSTTITLDKELKSRLAPGYMENLGPAANWSLPVLAGAGGVRTTVNDLLLFAAANLAPPKNQLGKAIEMAWAVHQKPIADSDPLIGLGWHVQADGTRWHNGQTGGYHSMIMINRINKTSLVLMTNTATQEVDQLATDLMKMLSGAKVTPRKFEKPVDVSPEAMQKLVGKYELAPGAVFTVEVVDGKLMIGLTGQPSLPVLARSETVWFSKLVDATITFKQFKNGRYDSLVLNQGGVKQTAKRIDEPVNASQKGEKPVNVSADKVQKLVGKYEFSPGTVLTVETDEGKLMVRLTGQQSIQVFAHSDNIWYAKAVKATILFNLDKDGKCDSLVLLQNDTKQKAVRQKESTDVAQKDEKPIEVPVEALQKFVGTYELTPKLLFTVEATDGKLMIGLTGQPSHQVYPKSETVWFYKVVEATITFNLDKNGKCDSLVLFQNGAKQTAKRKK